MRTLVHAALAFLCLLFTVGSHATPSQHPAHGEQPPLLLVSIDGFRADYLNRGISPTLSMLADQGVHAAKGMRPSFPSLTFPNHYTIVTGLYPDDSGIVDNSMYTAKLGSFTLGNRKAVQDARWWNEGMPIWVSADEQGLKTATLFWPGSEAPIHGHHPDHWKLYDVHMSYDARVDQILKWLDLPKAQRPDFLTLYFENVDTQGHWHGPHSPQVNQAIRQVDAAMARLVAGLKKRHLFKHMNIIVLADHGMATTPPKQRILLDRIIAPSAARVVSTGAISSIIPNPGHEAEVETALLKKHDHMTCWKKSQIPARLHYGHNPRVPPIVCSAQVGWLIISDETHLLHDGKPLWGEHGYDNFAPQMRALFLAHGPDFRSHVVVPTFPNVDVYPLMAHLLHIKPAHTDGDYKTVEAMLKPADR